MTTENWEYLALAAYGAREGTLSVYLLSADTIPAFRADLLAWYERHRRDLPWRQTTDPYRIWISEIMLQQTRVAAVIPYYERFLARFPDVASLAKAPEPDLLACWAGLGYYYRARNLQRAAQQIVEAGRFPSDYEGILSLAGVGEYTAAAVGSIAFGLPYPVVDGNVYRVTSRLFNDGTNIAGSGARAHFTHKLIPLLDVTHPGAFNQAMMEVGATVCLPKRPQCLLCPVRGYCEAYRAGNPERLPVKTKGLRNPEELRTLLIVQQGDRLLLWQRPPEARLMPGFWELPETEHLPRAVFQRKLGTFRHGITVHNYRFEIWAAELDGAGELGACQWVSQQEAESLPLSTIVRKTLKLLVGQKAAKAG